MSKGTQTRERILMQAAGLFNSRGYFGASMSDLMEATGMEKGGIYNHFGSKDALALEAFEYSASLYGQRMVHKVKEADGAVNKLLAILECFRLVIDDPPIPGGCPLLNSAIESDDAHPLLKEKVKAAMTRLLKFTELIATDGIKNKELRKEIDPKTLATTLIATLEGGVMLSKLYDDKQKMYGVIEQMQAYVRQCARNKDSKKSK